MTSTSLSIAASKIFVILPLNNSLSAALLVYLRLAIYGAAQVITSILNHSFLGISRGTSLSSLNTVTSFVQMSLSEKK